MKDVSGATNSESKSSSKGWACFAAVAVGFLFFLSLSAGSKNQTGDTVISGQAKQTTHIQEETTIGNTLPTTSSGSKSSGGGGGWGWPLNKGPKDVEQDVEDEVLFAESAFEKTIAEQLALQQPTVSLKISSVLESTRKSLDKLLGDSDLVGKDDIEKLGQEIESKLRRDVDKFLKEKTADLLEAEDNEMEIQADLETEDINAQDETEAEEIIVDLQDEEAKLIIDLREKIDLVVGDLLTKIKLMAGVIAKEQLEVLLIEKTGTTYKVTLDEEGNLVSFKKRSSSTSTSTGKSSSTSTTSSSKPTSSSSSSGQSSTTSSHHKSSSSGSGTTTGTTSSHSSSTHKSSSSQSSATKDVTKPKESTHKSSSSQSSATKDVTKPKEKKTKTDNDRRARSSKYLR